MKAFIKRNIPLLLAIAVFLIFLVPIFIGTAYALLFGPTGSVWLGIFPWILINGVVELPAALVAWGVYKKSRVGYVAAGIVVPVYFMAMLPQLWFEHLKGAAATIEEGFAILVGVAMLVYYWRLAVTKKKAVNPVPGAPSVNTPDRPKSAV